MEAFLGGLPNRVGVAYYVCQADCVSPAARIRIDTLSGGIGPLESGPPYWAG